MQIRFNDYICINKQTNKIPMAKIRKNEMLELIVKGSTLVKTISRIYGTYFYIITRDGTTIHNVHLGDCKKIASMDSLKKTMVEPDLFEFTFI